MSQPAIAGNVFGTENGRVARSTIRLAKAVLRNAARDFALCHQRPDLADRLPDLRAEIRKTGAELRALYRMLPAIDELDRREAAERRSRS